MHLKSFSNILLIEIYSKPIFTVIVFQFELVSQETSKYKVLSSSLRLLTAVYIFRRILPLKELSFILGNENLHLLTKTGNHRLRIELEDWDGSTVYAEYSSFAIGDETSNYKLSVSGYSGTAGKCCHDNVLVA